MINFIINCFSIIEFDVLEMIIDLLIIKGLIKYFENFKEKKNNIIIYEYYIILYI